MKFNMALVNDNVLDEIKKDLKENYPELYLEYGSKRNYKRCTKRKA